MVVVECGHNASCVERRGIALIVFNSIDVGMKDIRIGTQDFRGERSALQGIIIVGIDAGYHILTQLRPQLVLQYGLLALAQRGARGEHNLKIIMLALERL